MKSPPFKLLLSARDPGAWGNIAVLCCLFSGDRDFCYEVAASGIASQRLQERGIEHHKVMLDQGGDHVATKEESSGLIAEAQRLINEIQPDLIITSISSIGAGIDEALIVASRVPVLTLQDFWGDVNTVLGKNADQYLVLDQFAARLTEKRHNVPTSVTGLPKYLEYRSLDAYDLKREIRKRLGLAETRKLIGWFGQSPDVPGHESVFQKFLRAVARLPDGYDLLLKEHPKFDVLKQEHIREAKLLDISLVFPEPHESTEGLLAGCDLVVTPFSLCGLDHAVLSSMSSAPIGSVVYLMCNPEIRDFAQTTCGMISFPIVEHAGAGICIESDDIVLLADIFQESASGKSAQSYHRCCHQIVKHFDFPSFKEKALGMIEDNLKK